MDLGKTERHKNFIIHTFYYALILLLGYLFIEYALSWIMPFLLGFLIALLFKPLVQLLSKTTHLSRRISAFIIVLLGYILLGFLLWLGGHSLYIGIKNFCFKLPQYYAQDILPFLEYLNREIFAFANRISPDVAAQVGQTLDGMVESIKNYIVEFSTTILSALAGASKKLPLLLISLIFTILSSLFISMDYAHVLDFIKRQIPEKHRTMLIDIKDYLGKTLYSYLRAYLILMGITFIEISVGLLCLRVDNPFGIAGVIAIADALPVLGTGTIVLPWAVICLFKGEFYLAIGLILLYLIVTIVRQFIEPKIVGDQLGLPPLVTIICIYLGFVWFGVLGAILFPVVMNIIFKLQKADKIHLWK